MNFKELLGNIDQEAFTFGREDLERFLETEQSLAKAKAENREQRFRILDLEDNLYNAVRMLESVNDRPITVFDLGMMRRALPKQLQENTK